MAGGYFTKARFALRCMVSLVLYLRQFWVLLYRWYFQVLLGCLHVLPGFWGGFLSVNGGTFGCGQMSDSEPLGLSKVMVFILISDFSIFFNTGMSAFHFLWVH